MSYGYYGVVSDRGNEITVGVGTWSEAHKVAQDCLRDNPECEACEIYVGGSTTREGDDPGDTWEITAEGSE